MDRGRDRGRDGRSNSRLAGDQHWEQLRDSRSGAQRQLGARGPQPQFRGGGYPVSTLQQYGGPHSGDRIWPLYGPPDGVELAYGRGQEQKVWQGHYLPHYRQHPEGPSSAYYAGLEQQGHPYNSWAPEHQQYGSYHHARLVNGHQQAPTELGGSVESGALPPWHQGTLKDVQQHDGPETAPPPPPSPPINGEVDMAISPADAAPLTQPAGDMASGGREQPGAGAEAGKAAPGPAGTSLVEQTAAAVSGLAVTEGDAAAQPRVSQTEPGPSGKLTPDPKFPISFGFQKKPGVKIPKNPNIFRALAKSSAPATAYGTAAAAGAKTSHKDNPAAPAPTQPAEAPHVAQTAEQSAQTVGGTAAEASAIAAKRSRWGPEKERIKASRWGVDLASSQIASPAEPTAENPSSPVDGLASPGGAPAGRIPASSAPPARKDDAEHRSDPAAKQRLAKWRQRALRDSPDPGRGRSRSRDSTPISSRSSSYTSQSRSLTQSRSGSGRSSLRHSNSSSPRHIFHPPPAPKREADGRTEASPLREQVYDRPIFDRRRFADRSRHQRSPARDRHRDSHRSSFYSRRSPSVSPRHRSWDRRDGLRDRSRRSPPHSNHWDRGRRHSRSPSPSRARQVTPLSEKQRSCLERHTVRGSQPARPAREPSPEEGEVRASPVQHRTQAVERHAHVPTDMELETSSEDGSAEPELPPLPVEPPPTHDPARAKLLADMAKFTEKCQVRLNNVFTRHNLERKPAADIKANAALATQLYEIMTCAHSDRLILEFDDNPRDERSEGEEEDELACLGGPAAWGFPSWLPHPLASLDKAPPVPEASPWRTLEPEAMVTIPLEGPVGTGQLPDPRPYAATAAAQGGVSPPWRQLIPLPAWVLRPTEEDEDGTESGCSWSKSPKHDMVEEVSSAGVPGAGLSSQPPLSQPANHQLPLGQSLAARPQLGLPKMNALPPPRLGLPPQRPPPLVQPAQQPRAPAAARVPLPHAACTQQAPPPAAPPLQRLEPENGDVWAWINKRRQLSKETTSLESLRQRAAKGGSADGVVQGACAFRAADNLWLPIGQSKVTLKDLEWAGKDHAPKRPSQAVPGEAAPGKPAPRKAAPKKSRFAPKAPLPAATSMQRWFAALAAKTKPPKKRVVASAAGPSKLPRPASTSGADVPCKALSNEAISAWQRRAVADRRKALAHAEERLRSHRQASTRPGTGEQAQQARRPTTWGPKPPPHIAAMLRGRLGLRVLGSKEGETLAAKVIEDAFKSVMAKEPERQARLKAEQEEAERQQRQAELRRQAELHKRAEEKRKQEKAEAALQEQRRAERRAREQQESERAAREELQLRKAQEQEQRRRQLHKERELKAREEQRLQERDQRQRAEAERRTKGKAANASQTRRQPEPALEPAERAAKRHQPAPAAEPRQDSDGPQRQRSRPASLARELQRTANSLSKPAAVQPQQVTQVKEEEGPVAAEREETPAFPSQSRSTTPSREGSLPPHRGRSRGQGRGRGRGRGRRQRSPSEVEEEQPEISDEEYVPAAKPQVKGGGRKRVRSQETEGPRRQASSSVQKRSRLASTRSASVQDQEAEEDRMPPQLEAREPAARALQEDDGFGDAHFREVRAKLERQRIPEAMDSMLIALRKYDREQLNELFADPVCTKQYPDYPDVVREPMDLKTLGKRMKTFPKTRQGMEAFKAAVELMARNAAAYGQRLGDTDLQKTAAELHNHFLALYAKETRDINSLVFMQRR